MEGRQTATIPPSWPGLSGPSSPGRRPQWMQNDIGMGRPDKPGHDGLKDVAQSSNSATRCPGATSLSSGATPASSREGAKRKAARGSSGLGGSP